MSNQLRDVKKDTKRKTKKVTGGLHFTVEHFKQ